MRKRHARCWLPALLAAFGASAPVGVLPAAQPVLRNNVTTTEVIAPSLLLNAEELATKRIAWQGDAYAGMRRVIANAVAADDGSPLKDAYDNRIRFHTLAWLIDPNPQHLARIQTLARELMATESWQEPRYKGLTRAYVALSIALAYTFTGNEWSPELRAEVAPGLHDIAVEMVHSMGRGANTRTPNNWQAVRYSAAGLAALASNTPQGRRLAERCYDLLLTHYEANLAGGKWNPEGAGYLHYPLMFTGYFAIAAERAGVGDLREDMPPLGDSLWTVLNATAPIATNDIWSGVNLDLSDDNLGTAWQGLTGTLAWWYQNDPEQLAAARWVIDRWVGEASTGHWEISRAGTLMGLLAYPATTPERDVNPIRGRTSIDPVHGIVITRDHWAGPNDIILGISACHRRPYGAHGGPDTNTLRLIGRGALLIVGGGRTGNPAGTTGLFPADLVTRHDRRQLGSLDHALAGSDGSVVATVSGSGFGLSDHQRWVGADFSHPDADVVIINRERATGARRWRLATPELNQIETGPNWFTITAPNGTRLHGQLAQPTSMREDLVERGRRFMDRPAGRVAGVAYGANKVLEIACEDEIQVVLTISAGAPPAVTFNGSAVSVGDTTYQMTPDGITGGALPTPQPAAEAPAP